MTFSVYVGGLVSSLFRGSKAAFRHAAEDGFRHAAEDGFFASSEVGFRWCLAVLSPSPRGCCSGCVRVGCVAFCVYVLGLVSSPLGVPKLPLRHAGKDGFLLGLSPDLGGVWLF